MPGLHAQLPAEAVIAREPFVATAIEAGDAALVQARVVRSHTRNDAGRAGGQRTGRRQDAAADRVEIVQRIQPVAFGTDISQRRDQPAPGPIMLDRRVLLLAVRRYHVAIQHATGTAQRASARAHDVRQRVELVRD